MQTVFGLPCLRVHPSVEIGALPLAKKSVPTVRSSGEEPISTKDGRGVQRKNIRRSYHIGILAVSDGHLKCPLLFRCTAQQLFLVTSSLKETAVSRCRTLSSRLLVHFVTRTAATVNHQQGRARARNRLRVCCPFAYRLAR